MAEALPVIVHFGVCDEKDLIGITGFLQQQGKGLNEGRLKACVLNQLLHPRIQMLLERFGVSEIFPYDIPAKSLLHKTHIAIKLMKKNLGYKEDGIFRIQGEPELFFDESKIKLSDSTSFITDLARLEMPEDNVFRARLARSRKRPRRFVHALPDQWPSGIKAARVMEVSALCQEIPGEVIHQAMALGQVTLEFPTGALFALGGSTMGTGEKIEIAIQTKNFRKEYSPDISGVIVEQRRCITGDLITVQLEDESIEKAAAIQTLIEQRQAEISSFMKAVKG